MGTLYSVKGGSGANYFLLPIYRPTRAQKITIRPLYGLETGTPRVTIGMDPLQRDQTGPLDIDFSMLKGGHDNGIELLIPQVRRENAEQGGPPPFFNIWVRTWSMGEDTIHVRVDSDLRTNRQQIGWVSFLAHGAQWLVETSGTVLIQTRVSPITKLVPRF